MNMKMYHTMYMQNLDCQNHKENISIPKFQKYTNTKNNELDIWDIGGTDPIPGISDGYCNNVNYLILFGINQQPYINIVKNFSPNVIIINYTNQVNFQNFLDSL